MELVEGDDVGFLEVVVLRLWWELKVHLRQFVVEVFGVVHSVQLGLIL